MGWLCRLAIDTLLGKLTIGDLSCKLTIPKTLSPFSTSTKQSLTKLFSAYFFLYNQKTPTRKAVRSKTMKIKVSSWTSPTPGASPWDQEAACCRDSAGTGRPASPPRACTQAPRTTLIGQLAGLANTQTVQCAAPQPEKWKKKRFHHLEDRLLPGWGGGEHKSHYRK